jgi:hypothetical protein
MTFFAKLRGRSVGEYALLSEAMVALAIGALSLAILPFRRVVAFVDRPAPRSCGSERARIIAGVRWGVAACARRVPWRAKCFEQGLAAVWMLQRRGIAATLHYGVATDAERGLIAHVWVRARGQDVIGCETKSAFTEVARFPMENTRGH